MIVAMSKQCTAIIYYDEEVAKQSGLPYTMKFESLPDGTGKLKTDLDRLWWESINPQPAPPTPLEQLRADVDFIALMQGVTL